MTPEAQRVAIAEACGWSDIEPCTCCEGISRGYEPMPGAHKKHLPDYLKDRNPMIEAIKTLDHSERIDFLCELDNFGITGEWAILTADCDALAEAFLRTLNLWKDSTPE